ncbi:MAG TPA: hypothetical protein VFH48_02565 [Chloroflexota bacterium]|nr:hypothetical protein [Chloroflexota bacterium]
MTRAVLLSGMVPNDDRSEGLSDSAQERLIGLLLIVGGVAGFGVTYLLWLFQPAAIPVPPGLPSNLSTLTSPLNCMLPVSVVGSCLLVLLGLRKLILGD